MPDNMGLEPSDNFKGTNGEWKRTKLKDQKFDIIIADLPCSGSGTWARTPEQMYFFKQEKIEYYSSLQKRIVSNLYPYLEKGGLLVYITCSVFKNENEEVVDFILENFDNLRMAKMEILKGYHLKADTMFAASFVAS
jgi:16S rRNA (cytosine967-C5)-methyltransferase